MKQTVVALVAAASVVGTYSLAVYAQTLRPETAIQYRQGVFRVMNWHMRTLFAMAATLVVIAVLLPSGAPPHLARNMAIGHGVFVALFTASGLLFRHASLAEVK